MNSFLFNIATQLYSKYNDDLSNFCLIFPNKRATLFFNSYLNKIIDKPILSPKYYTINELFIKLSGFEIADKIFLVNQLYKVFCEITLFKESFDDFYFWGEMLLNDFDNIDKYLVDAKKLFSNIDFIKELETNYDYLTEDQIQIINTFWSGFNTSKMSKHKEYFISVWKALYPVYEKYKNILKVQQLVYEGMIYREVVENIKNDNKIEFYDKKYVFIGFNALNKCEEFLFTYLKNIDKALFAWDYDNSFVKNKYHQAGFFIRENLKKFPSSFEEIENSLNNNHNINIISVSGNIYQAKILPQLLNSLNISTTEYINTAIVMADENLLLPVLYSLPENISDINISIGYPLAGSWAFGFLELLISLQTNYIENNNVIKFYYKDVLNILNIPVFSCNNSEIVNSICNQIISKNIIYTDLDIFKDFELAKVIFIPAKDQSKLTEYLLSVFSYVYNLIDTKKDKKYIIEKETIYSLYLLVKKLNESLLSLGITIKTETFVKLLKRIAYKTKVPFIGEPLAGIQILGILETRNLEFENIIMLSMNEGIFPDISVSGSFIPYNLRRGFDLPTLQHIESIYAYYFYRLINKGKNIYLVYSTSNDDFRYTEMSRFLQQLKYNSNYKIKELNFDFQIQISNPLPITIEKDKIITDVLNQYTSASFDFTFSAHSLNDYIDCPLRFYFRNIKHLKEPLEIVEEPSSVELGNILHKSIYFLYKPYINKKIDISILNKLLKEDNLKTAVKKAFNEIFQFHDDNNFELNGSNFIIFEVALGYLKKIIEFDKEMAPFEILFLEDEFYQKLIINDNTVVKLKHKIDRIDKRIDDIRVVDYKTGKEMKRFSSVESLFDKENKERNRAVFQILFYAQMINEKYQQKTKVIPALYVIEQLNKDENITLEIKEKERYMPIIAYVNYYDEFIKRLKMLIEEILNPEIPFMQTNNVENCSFCPYKDICER